MSKIRLHGSSSGYTEIAPVAASGNNTLTLPDDGTIISKDSNGAVGVTSVVTTTATITTAKVGAAVTISESGIEASGIGITCANINGTQIGGRRNLIINGAMQVAQRGTVTSITSSTYAGPDRFRFGIASHGTFTVSQDSSAPTGSGFANSLKLDCTTADTSVASSAAGYFQHKLEGQDCQRIKKGTSSAEQLSVQFWVKSNKTGTYALQCQDNDNSRNFTTTYSISSADTWEKKTITIPADTTGALDDDNAVSLTFNFWLVAGTDYTSGSASATWYGNTATNMAKGHTVNIADSTSNTWYMTGFQVEIGSQATPFEHRSYADEFLSCCRYYFFTNSQHFFQARGNNSDGFVGFVETQVPLRASPSVTLTGGLRHWGIDSNSSSTTQPTVPSFRTNQKGVRVNQTGHSGVNDDCVMTVQTDGSDGQGLAFDSEL